MASLPLPVPDEVTEPFWAYCRDHELRAQRCTACGLLRHPPRVTCPRCGSTEVEWQKLSGRGTVFTYGVSHQAIHPALEGRTPFTTLIVELEEGLRFTSNLADGSPSPDIGAAVEVVFDPVTDEVTLPRFRVVK
ncbi:MAG TPA: Zn-ribbon domain-containing OB-fold protein [Dehalococcoidia bacterium]|jgi:uncharacterized OB-fold protein|nr:Zn-ribbon domain-containing OB-fold protein [Dehalococcoidia bacterium]